jgi:ABC-type lipoprotein release transport system permease subunit
MTQLFMIAFRSLMQHRRRTFVLGSAIAVVTALLIGLTGVYTGMRDTLLLSATTLMSGHVNVGGFYKVTSGQAAAVVTGYEKIEQIVKREVPEVEYVTQRGRGWAKLVSDNASMQVGIGGIDINLEPGFLKVVVVKSGDIADLKKQGSIMIFEEQAKKLDVKVGDRMTISAQTFKGTNNTIDVTLVAIAQNVGMLSSWNVFVNDQDLRNLYGLNKDTTGAVLIYLKDLKAVPAVQARLREVFAKEGYGVMDPNPVAFWMKFDAVNREAWTGQKLDITNWEDETAFVKWFVTLFSVASIIVIFVLVVIIGVGMMNVMWISIRERTREIGTLRAIGMQRFRVLAMFVIEGFLLGALGTIAGVLLGNVLGVALTAANVKMSTGAQLVLMTDHLVVTPTLGWSLFAVVFITGVITLISIIPSFLAARLKPVTAMSHIG